MLNQLAGAGVTEVMDNSSGNAGASLAAYAGLAGKDATVYVPAASAVESKKAHIRAYGGRIIESDNLPAEIYAAAAHTTYASHAWNPSFVLGQQDGGVGSVGAAWRARAGGHGDASWAWRVVFGLLSRLQGAARGPSDRERSAHDRCAVGGRRPDSSRMGAGRGVAAADCAEGERGRWHPGG